ncbi:MAG: hypothetical protein II290_06870 [Oscillospiraceae bacterium]|nr:hypothetical protein [Oscillospiraceae bacterium]
MARKKYDFRPDANHNRFKGLHMTRLQRLNILKWLLYAVLCIFLLVVQDVIMSRVRIFGAPTDLPAAVILLITVLVGSNHGSVFVLAASTFYWFSGSAPGPYCIGLMTFLGVIAAVLRQVWWRRGLRSTVICAGCALILYEIAIFVIALVSGLAPWSRVVIFLLTALYSCAIMVPLYPLACKIGKIGGEPWKE